MRGTKRGSLLGAAVLLCGLATPGCGSEYAAVYGGGVNTFVFTDNAQWDIGTFQNATDTTLAGTVTLISTFPTNVGTWTVTVDGGGDGALWQQIFWNTESEAAIPPGTTLTVAVRAADNPADLPSLGFVNFASGSSLAGIVGRYLEIQATLTGIFPSKPGGGSTEGFIGQTPILSDITVTVALPGNYLVEQVPFGGPFFGTPVPE